MISLFDTFFHFRFFQKKKKKSLINKLIIIIEMETDIRTNTRWDYDDTYKICGKIGEGGNADTFLVRNGDGNFQVLKVSHMLGDEAEQMIKRESDALIALENCHRRIKLIDSSSESPDQLGEGEYPWIIMDYVPGTTLHDFLEAFNKMKDKYTLVPSLKYCFIYSIAREIYDVHEMGYTHRDIKPDNILIDANLWPHLGDFGDLTPKLITDHIHGTINFLPPEAFPLNPNEPIQCGHPYDVFSFGGTLLQIITYVPPFSDLLSYPDYEKRVKERLQQGELDNRFEPGGELEDCIIEEDRDLYELVKLCWAIDPEERPSMGDILQIIDQIANAHLDGEQLDTYQQIKENFPIDDDDDLGSVENVVAAIEEEGFCSFSNNFALLLAAKELNINVDESSNFLEVISCKKSPSIKSQ